MALWGILSLGAAPSASGHEICLEFEAHFDPQTPVQARWIYETASPVLGSYPGWAYYAAKLVQVKHGSFVEEFPGPLMDVYTQPAVPAGEDVFTGWSQSGPGQEIRIRLNSGAVFLGNTEPPAAVLNDDWASSVISTPLLDSVPIEIVAQNGTAPEMGYGFAFSDIECATCPPAPGCPSPLSTRTDGFGNQFVLTCEPEGFCVRYVPAVGDPIMVSKCAFCGGINSAVLVGTPGTPGDTHTCPDDFPNCPEKWLRARHLSQDDYNPLDPQGTCDDLPETVGLRDGILQTFIVCSRELVVRSEIYLNGIPVGVGQLTYDEATLPTFCDFSIIRPDSNDIDVSCCSAASARRFVGASTVPPRSFASSSIELLGVALGGDVTVVIDTRSATMNVPPSTPLSQVASSIASLVNTHASFAGSGVIATADAQSVSLFGTDRSRLSMISEDPGILQPAGPSGFEVRADDSTAALAWMLQDSYDVLYLSKGARNVAALDPMATSYVDADPLLSAGSYVLVGWKNGMPSAPVIATDVPVAVESPQSRQTLEPARVIPNPFNPHTTIQFDLTVDQRVQVRVYTVDGRLVRALLDRELAPGHHAVQWDGRDGSGQELASGVYFYEILRGSLRQRGKMALLR